MLELKVIKKEDIPAKHPSKYPLQKLLRWFLDSDGLCVEVVGVKSHYASIYVARSVLHNAIRRSHYAIRVLMRGDKLYLVKVI